MPMPAGGSSRSRCSPCLLYPLAYGMRSVPLHPNRPHHSRQKFQPVLNGARFTGQRSDANKRYGYDFASSGSGRGLVDQEEVHAATTNKLTQLNIVPIFRKTNPTEIHRKTKMEQWFDSGCFCEGGRVVITYSYSIFPIILQEMLLVETTNSDQQQQLEEEFAAQEGLFQVPLRQATAVASLLKAATYHHFHATPTPSALKMQEFALRAVSGVLSLDLYRAALTAMHEGQERCQLYQEYLLRMNEAFEEAPITPLLSPSSPLTQNLEELLESAGQCDRRSSSILEMPDVPMLRLDSSRGDCVEEVQSKLTKNTYSTVSPTKSTKETLGGMARLTNFFYSPSAVYSRQDWQTKRDKGNESSRQIESFKKRGSTVLEANGSLQSLLESQLTYDLKRQELESAPLAKQALQRKQREDRYHRKIKEALIFSKIGLRKRKP